MANPVKSHPPSLQLYRQAFVGNSAAQHTIERTEVMVEVAPGDEVARVVARIRLDRLKPREDTEVLTVSSPSGGSFEVTELESGDPNVSIRAQIRGETVVVFAKALKRQAIAGLVIRFKLWEACSPLSGYAPYVRSTLGVVFSSPTAPRRPILLTVSTPAGAGPRSTRGNYLLAYPSRIDAARRLTNIYFARSPARLAYTFGSNEGLTTPWLHIGRAGATAILIYIVAVLAARIPQGDRFTALIAVFVGAAGIIWDFSREIASFAVYNAARTAFHIAVAVAQVIVLGVLSASVLALTTLPSLLPVVGVASLVVGAMLLVVAITCLVAHRQGFWQGFECDHEGCSTRFRWRRARPECYYTGRVQCNEHIESVCGTCVHGPDLHSGLLNTADRYASEPKSCVSVGGSQQ